MGKKQTLFGLFDLFDSHLLVLEMLLYFAVNHMVTGFYITTFDSKTSDALEQSQFKLIH